MWFSNKRCNTIGRRIKRLANDYFEQTTLHGFRYISYPNSTKFKSGFWSLICVTMMILCVILIRSQIAAYQANRITTTIATTAFPVWKVPFPAITICNFNVVYKKNVEKFRELMKHHVSNADTAGFFSNLESLIQVANSDDDQISHKDYNHVTLFLKSLGYDTDRLMAELAQPCDELLKACYWKTKEIDCNRIFHPSKTSSGYCCSFNYEGALEKDGLLGASGRIFAGGIGPAFSLEVYLDPEIDQYTSFTQLSKGVDVLLHESNSFPDLKTFTTMISPGSQVAFVVKPEVIESDIRIRAIDQATRGCAFEDEVHENWVRTYSYTTCINECKAKASIELCGCVPFYYPTRSGVRYCDLNDSLCLNKGHWNQRNIYRKTSFKGKVQEHTIEEIMENTMTCDCYPQCNEVTYSYQVDLQSTRRLDALENTSVLNVYFGRVACKKFLRSQFLTWELIVASIGGSIGLCLGGSILSVVEFFYHVFDAVFSKYNQKVGNKIEKKNYKLKLYISDFKRVNCFQLAKKRVKVQRRPLEAFKKMAH